MAVWERTRRRSIWRHTGLFLTALIVAGIWSYLLYVAILLGPESPPRSNSILLYILAHKSGSVKLADIIAEPDWETACIAEKGMNPVGVAERRIGRTITQVNTPLIDEGLLDYLWKIVLVKDGTAAVHYFDERDIEFQNFNSCMSFRDAILTFGPDGAATLHTGSTPASFDKDSSID